MSNTILACLEGDKKHSPLLIQLYEMPTASENSSLSRHRESTSRRKSAAVAVLFLTLLTRLRMQQIVLEEEYALSIQHLQPLFYVFYQPNISIKSVVVKIVYLPFFMVYAKIGR